MNENPIGDFVNRLEARTEPTAFQTLGAIVLVIVGVAGVYFTFN